MKELLDKLSSYNLFNYLLPGTMFVAGAQRISDHKFKQDSIVVELFLYYFIGLVISRIGSLERFRLSCSDAVTAVPDVVRTLVGHEEAEGRRHQLADVVEGARTRRAQERLEFGEGEFDWIEVGTVGREKSQERSGLF